MQIVRYTKEYKDAWDTFVDKSKNGTFLLKRDFMEYHSDRFRDCSFLFFEGNKLLALLPANINEDTHTLYSHQGLTYGGLLLSREIMACQVLQLFDELLTYLHENLQVEKLIYKPIPHIYHNYPSEEDLYALFRHKAVLQQRLLSSVIDKKDVIPFSRIRKRHIRKAQEAGMTVCGSTDFTAFWKILNDRLSGKYHVNAVHTQKEIEYLHSLFPEQIQLFEARIGEVVVGGCVIFIMDDLIHIQYSSATEEGMELGALDLLFYHVTYEVCPEKRYIDIGNSNEQGGWVLNENLIFRKETCGARAIVFDTYELNL